ncbi:hypothetical protein HV819_00260 [Anaerococcus sp. AGMB00486]|uniref:Uncharacterized protein n=1 Tax=Anaerococcus faecalis TaxID=2742993 RepID=A0ABX2N7E7_9FIRM|nr:hypothetical protein [Anaerococcus faecalis]NVF10452.1 hypothetical protein [Anaerococcus faecalis]
MITIEEINKKLGFNFDEYEIKELKNTEYDPDPKEDPFSKLTLEELNFIYERRKNRIKSKHN